MISETTLTKVKGESDKMFHRLVIYATTGEQNYQKTADILNEELSQKSQNESPQKEITAKAIAKNAERWAWNERISLEEAKKILKDAEELDEEFRTYNRKIINILKKLIDFLDDKLDLIISNVDGYATSTQMNLLANFMNILDKAIYNYRLSCGRSTDNKELNHQGELAISGEVKSENTLKYTAEEMKQIQATTSEPDEEVQEFLDQI